MELNTIVMTIGVGLIVTVVGGLVVLFIWHKVLKQPEGTPEPTPEPGPPAQDDTAMQLLKAMREQIRGKSGHTVVASEPAIGLGMEPGSHELDRCLYNLIEAGYLNKPSKPWLTTQYVYQITPAGIDAADAY